MESQGRAPPATITLPIRQSPLRPWWERLSHLADLATSVAASGVLPLPVWATAATRSIRKKHERKNNFAFISASPRSLYKPIDSLQTKRAGPQGITRIVPRAAMLEVPRG